MLLLLYANSLCCVFGREGKGIKEVQIIQWFVEPEARVEQFDKLCEVQSDKAAAEVRRVFLLLPNIEIFGRRED